MVSPIARFILVFFFLFTGNAKAQPTAGFTQQLDPVKAREDILLLKSILEEANTTLYYYASKKKVDKAFTKALAGMKDSVTYNGFIAAVSSIMHTISCGHSGWDHSAAYKEYRAKNEKFLPFDVLIISGRYYLVRDYSLEQTIPQFAEITSINGQAVRTLTKRLTPHMYSDGYANTGSSTEIAANLRMAYSNFIAKPGSFKITYKPKPNSLYRIEELRALSLPEIDSIRKTRYGADEGLRVPLRINIIDSIGAAVFTAKTFSNQHIQNANRDFISFTDSAFSVLQSKGLKNLVIDLRGNRGGWTANGKYLFSHFIDTPTPYIKRVYTQKYKDYSFAPLITEEAGYLDTMKLEPNKEGFYEWTNNPNLIAIPAHRYQGSVYILMDAFTRSAASVFCALMKEHTNALFIGEETSASQSGTNGMVNYIKLPYTGVPYHFSTARYDFNISKPKNHKGIIPDFEVQPDWESVSTNDDKVMQATMKLITTGH